MGSSSSTPDVATGTGAVDSFLDKNIPDESLSSNVVTAGENEQKKRAYANLKSAAADSPVSFFAWRGIFNDGNGEKPSKRENVVEQVYNEDFETIDHIQAMRFPPYVAKQIKDAVRNESERRCAEKEKTMSRCLQDKMWTTWKCQKERDTYYHCVEDEERRNSNPRQPDEQNTTNPENFVDLLTAYRWKFNLGVLHGEIIGRNNVMRKLWSEHFPDRELPHPWVKDEE